MKFSEIKYERPDAELVKKQYESLTKRLIEAQDYASAKAVFLEKEELDKHMTTASTLAEIRHSVDTRDAFYNNEKKFWNDISPVLQEYEQKWTDAMTDHPCRKGFEEEYGKLLFIKADMARQAFSPEIIPDLQKENELVQEYEKLLASAQVAFEGSFYTLSQMTPFKTDPDDARRLAAWKAEGQWYKNNQEKLDLFYDELVHLRHNMALKLGFDSFLPLGYLRMDRNCYTKEDVARFREAVQKYVVPLAEGIYKEQAKRLGKEYPMSFADNALEFRSGNPRPYGTAQEILEQGRRFYDELSPETSEFFRTMTDCELLDVLSTEGKEGGGYCTSLPDYKVPFIFANFNGTQGDVEVVTHEAGHAFEEWMNRDRVPNAYLWPSSEACEVHSMSMEFFAWPWAELFFGKDTDKYYYSHLAKALTFIPYGTLVDHYQHEVFENPDMTPKERHAVWKRLMGVYMPWMRLDGEIPFYADGEHWQLKHHIYSFPFYYIDYCLAQTVALEFWAMIQKDLKGAWEKYMKYTCEGGSRVFTDLLAFAGLESPFGDVCLRDVSAAAKEWLDHFDTGRLQ